jgi:type I restriction enzyme S subunit
MKLQPYPEYKDSGVPWLGKIPAHWLICRCRYLFREVDERSKDGKETHLSMSQKKGLIDSAKIEKWRLQSESYVGGKLCRTNDLVLNRLKAHLGVFACASQSGIVSPDYTVLRPITDDNPRFFEFLFKSQPFVTEFTKSTKGIVKGFWRLYTDNFYSIRVVMPSPEEQLRILRFIDSLTTKTNKFIRNKRRLIELLKEQKQNIINQAVTRGIDPDVKLKPSGVEWIGDIPEHWEVRKLKRVVSFNPSKSETQANPTDEGKVVFLPMENISSNGAIDCAEKRSLSEVWNGFTYFRRGDVVIAKITPCFENGKGACLKMLETDYGFGTTELIVLRPSKSITGDCLRFLTSTRQFLLLGEQNMTGAAGQQRIPSDFVKNYPIGLPPIEEQETIIAHIQDKSAEIDQTIARAEREIELMREYRTRLISDVVTGQVDVRGVEVPDVAGDDSAAVDESDDGFEDSEVSELEEEIEE